MTSDPKSMTDAEWREKLTAEQYHVLREAGTERAFSGQYDKHYDAGEYVCAGCGTQLFTCLLYTSPSPRDRQKSRMPSSA